MGIISDEDREYLKNEFNKNISKEVEILHFMDTEDSSEYNEQTKELLNELIELNENLELTEIDCSNKERMKEEGVSLCPSIKVKSERSGFVNFYGAPAGYEFGSLIEGIIDKGSDKEISISEENMKEIKSIDEPVDMKVFVTSSCPYCPQAVRTAHQLSMINENIKGSMVDANNFSELSREYQVSSVPHTVINGNVSFVGALSPEEVIKKIRDAIE